MNLMANQESAVKLQNCATISGALEMVKRMRAYDVFVHLTSIQKSPFWGEWTNRMLESIKGVTQICYDIRKLGGAASILSYHFAKSIFNVTQGEQINLFAWCALSAIKVLREEAYTLKKDYTKEIRQVVEEIAGLQIKVVSEADQVLVNQILHYRTKYLASEGHLLEAFEKHRDEHLEAPEDLEKMRRFGWTLHDCIAQSVDTLANRKLAEFFLNELLRVQYPKEMEARDAKLVSCYAYDVQKAKDFLCGIGEVRALEKDGDLASALVKAKALVQAQPQNVVAHLALARIYDKLLRYDFAIQEFLVADKLQPNEVTTHKSLAWAIIRKWGEILKNAQQDKKTQERLKKLLNEDLTTVMQMGALAKPSLEYSNLMRVFRESVAYFKKEVPTEVALKYLSFVQALDVQYFTEQDHTPYIPQDNPTKSYPSLVEKVITTFYNCALKTWNGQPLVKSFPWVVDFIGSKLERFPTHEWMPYYYGKLLAEQNRYEEARTYLKQVAQRKVNEFWIWQLLAETFPNDVGRQLACLCRSALCRAQNESMLCRTHGMLGEVLRAKGMDAEAAYEFMKEDTLRETQNWKKTARGAGFDAWLAKIKPVNDNMALYQQWSAQADEIVFGELPSSNAVATARYSNKEKKEFVALWWRDQQGGQHSISVKVSRFAALKKVVAGTPLRVWSELHGRGDQVFKVELRKDGAPWDVYPKTRGVLISHNVQRGVSWFVVDDNGNVCQGDWKWQTGIRAFAIGSVCELVLLPTKDGHRRLLNCEIAKGVELPSYVKRFEGNLNLPEGRNFGFVNSEIFVPTFLLEATSLISGVKVHGLAARSYDKAKNRVSWKAFTVEQEK